MYIYAVMCHLRVFDSSPFLLPLLIHDKYRPPSVFVRTKSRLCIVRTKRVVLIAKHNICVIASDFRSRIKLNYVQK